MTDRQLALHCFNLVPGIGSATLAELLDWEVEKIWKEGRLSDFVTIFGETRGTKVFHLYQEVRHSRVWDQEKRYFEKSEIQIVALDDPIYPELLGQIHRPPALLYVRGNIENLNHTLAVIGTRKFSSYGERVCYQLASALGSSGMIIVSGLAIGIDSIAHKGCLDAGGRTIAVLGGGIDDRAIAPRQNQHLAEKILRTGGALMSEYPPLTPPRKEFFPQRNRIVAGISQGILVIEAPQKSGTMITVEFGLEQNRDIFAIPGPIESKRSEGTNHLIKQGAFLVTQPEDVLSVFQVDVTLEERYLDEFPPEQQRIIHYLTEHSAGLGKMSEDLAVELTELMTNISLLELSEIVSQDSQGNYQMRVRIVEG